MTAREMQIAFQDYLDAQQDYNIPNLISDTIFHYINEAIDEYVIDHIKQFEQNQRVTDNIATLVINNFVIATTYTAPTWTGDTIFIDSAAFPANFRMHLNSRSVVQKANSGDYDFEVSGNARQANSVSGYTDFTQIVKRNVSVHHDDIRKLSEDPFWKTRPERPVITIAEQSIDVYTDSTFIVTNVIIDYIKEPASVTISTDCDLPDFTHRELVRMAVNKYLGTLSNNLNQS